MLLVCHEFSSSANMLPDVMPDFSKVLAITGGMQSKNDSVFLINGSLSIAPHCGTVSPKIAPPTRLHFDFDRLLRLIEPARRLAGQARPGWPIGRTRERLNPSSASIPYSGFAPGSPLAFLVGLSGAVEGTAGVPPRISDRWSSAAAHVRGRDDALVVMDRPLNRLAQNWRSFLARVLREEVINILHAHERTGHPLGDDEFPANLEEDLGRIPRRQKPGPKPSR